MIKLLLETLETCRQKLGEQNWRESMDVLKVTRQGLGAEGRTADGDNSMLINMRTRTGGAILNNAALYTTPQIPVESNKHWLLSHRSTGQLGGSGSSCELVQVVPICLYPRTHLGSSTDMGMTSVVQGRSARDQVKQHKPKQSLCLLCCTWHSHSFRGWESHMVKPQVFRVEKYSALGE